MDGSDEFGLLAVVADSAPDFADQDVEIGVDDERYPARFARAASPYQRPSAGFQ
jgi:hypothetical protein